MTPFLQEPLGNYQGVPAFIRSQQVSQGVFDRAHIGARCSWVSVPIALSFWFSLLLAQPGDRISVSVFVVYVCERANGREGRREEKSKAKLGLPFG